MPADVPSGEATGQSITIDRPTPAIFSSKPVSAWLIIGGLILFLLLAVGLFFETISPLADFPYQPYVEADSNAYWALSDVRPGSFQHHESQSDSGPHIAGNIVGPVTEARLFRTDFGILLFNVCLLLFTLWLVGQMKEFDRGVFTLLLILNPVLFSAVVTLNKEILAMAGMVAFIRYMSAKRYRGLLLVVSLVISFAARWQQAAVMVFIICCESRISPFRRKPLAGVITMLLFFTVGYTMVYRLAPNLIAGLLAQASGGHTIVLLDAIQGHFGFPLVVIPKILFNVMGYFITPWYFLSDYWSADFGNWHDQIFMEGQELLTTVLLFVLFFTGKLKLKHVPVYLLALYLILTAVNPMVQPRYEYPAYILLCLEASRYWHLDAQSHSDETDFAPGTTLPA